MWTYGSGETLDIARNTASTHMIAEIKRTLQCENRTSQKNRSHRTPLDFCRNSQKGKSSLHYHFLFYLVIFFFSGMERNIGKDEKDDLELFKGSLKDFDICGNN